MLVSGMGHFLMRLRYGVVTVTMALLLGLVYQNCPVAAAGAHTPWTGYIPVTMVDKEGYIPTDVTFGLVLSPEDSQFPLPAQSELSVGGKGQYRFGPILFDQPGDYRYLIQEVPPNDEKLKKSDERVYHLLVRVTNADGNQLQGTLVLCSVDGDDPDAPDGEQTGEGEQGKPDAILFSNHYEFIPVRAPGAIEEPVVEGGITPFDRWLLRTFGVTQDELSERQLNELKSKLSIARLLYGREWPGELEWMSEEWLSGDWWLDDDWWDKNEWWVQGTSIEFRSPHTGEENVLAAPIGGIIAAAGLMGLSFLLKKRRSEGDE